MNRTLPPQPWRRTILVGDVRERLADLPDGSVDCVITSPPYFALRDYGHAQQLGLEPNVAAWVAQLRGVLHLLRRVLRPAGVVWLNVADGYSQHPRDGAPRKSLLLGPQRLAVALVEDGWIIRNELIWAKSNPMPSSVRDRLTSTHELIYLLTQRPRYAFDLDAIRVPPRGSSPVRTRATERVYPPLAAVSAVHHRKVNHNRGLGGLRTGGITRHPLGKNPGDVLSVATAGYRPAHFATFPVALVEPLLRATCPERVCAACGTPWRRHRDEASDPGRLRAACTCNAPWRPGLVLDPFMGAGTVAVAAERHRRDWVGVELNPTYAAMAEARLAKARAWQATAQADQAA